MRRSILGPVEKAFPSRLDLQPTISPIPDIATLRNFNRSSPQAEGYRQHN
jgi:hypothetical protein